MTAPAVRCCCQTFRALAICLSAAAALAAPPDPLGPSPPAFVANIDSHPMG